MDNKKSKKIIWLEKALRIMSVLILKKYSPKVIGITGSVGKTSAKEALFPVLALKFRTRKNEKNYNNEIGIPLTIIGAESGNGSLLGWLKVFLKWLAILFLPIEYPEILILEMGADKPGDLRYLTDFLKLKIGVITEIAPSHIEFFGSLEKIAEEKSTVVKVLEKDDFAVLNVDSPYVKKAKNETEAQVLTYGFSEEADVRATDVSFIYEEASVNKIKGLSFKLNYDGTTIPVRLNNILAKHQIYAALAAACCGIAFKINLVDISSALENFASPCGRLNLIDGIGNSAIIDDTYNASPKATLAALDVLDSISAGRKIAVLGDMLELGVDTEKEHRNIASKFLKIKGDLFFAVGQRMEFAAEELAKGGFSKENIFVFRNPEEAAKKIKELIKENDLILVKGSQGMRMEKVVEEIMAEPNKAIIFLCRQEKKWKEKEFREV